MSSRFSWLIPLSLSLIAGGASGHLFSRLNHSMPATASLSSDCSRLESRLGELEEQCASLPRYISQVHASASPVTQAGASLETSAAEFEAAVRSVLARVDDERLESVETRRTQKQYDQIRSFVRTVGAELVLTESTQHDIEARLIAKSEEWRDAKESLGQSEQTIGRTPRQRKEARAALKKTVIDGLNTELAELLNAEQFARYQTLANEEHFELD